MTRRRGTVTPQIAADIITRYQAGQTPPTIARALNLAPDTIKRHLRKAGVPLRDDRKGQGTTTAADRIHQAGTTPRHIRAWAIANGHHIGRYGMPPDDITDAYLKAHQDPQ